MVRRRRVGLSTLVLLAACSRPALLDYEAEPAEVAATLEVSDGDTVLASLALSEGSRGEVLAVPGTPWACEVDAQRVAAPGGPPFVSYGFDCLAGELGLRFEGDCYRAPWLERRAQGVWLSGADGRYLRVSLTCASAPGRPADPGPPEDTPGPSDPPGRSGRGAP